MEHTFQEESLTAKKVRKGKISLLAQRNSCFLLLPLTSEFFTREREKIERGGRWNEVAAQIFRWFFSPHFHLTHSSLCYEHSFHSHPNWGSPYSNKCCGSFTRVVLLLSYRASPKCFFHLTGRKEKKALLSGWIVGKLQHNTHSHCRAGSERNFFRYSWCFEKRIKREEIGCVNTRRKKKVPSCTTFAFCAISKRRISMWIVSRWSALRRQCAVSFCEAQFCYTVGLN